MPRFNIGDKVIWTRFLSTNGQEVNSSSNRINKIIQNRIPLDIIRVMLDSEYQYRVTDDGDAKNFLEVRESEIELAKKAKRYKAYTL